MNDWPGAAGFSPNDSNCDATNCAASSSSCVALPRPWSVSLARNSSSARTHSGLTVQPADALVAGLVAAAFFFAGCCALAVTQRSSVRVRRKLLVLDVIPPVVYQRAGITDSCIGRVPGGVLPRPTVQARSRVIREVD